MNIKRDRRTSVTGLVWCAGLKTNGAPCNNRFHPKVPPKEVWFCRLHEPKR